jgi:D-arabinose 1-dehydrogenase-like Zn-dependent alcohol dehydrogenase
MKGKAAVLKGFRKPYEIQEFNVPEVEPGAILIKVSMANICGSDLHIWRGDLPIPIPEEGAIFGHEMTGRIAKLGKGVTTDSMGDPLKEGDRVIYCYFNPCGKCYQCLQGHRAACPNKLSNMAGSIKDPPHFRGAFAEYYYLQPGMFVFKTPQSLSDQMVAPVNCALSQVIYGLSQAGVRLDDTVVIQGAGGLGLNAIAVAREMGAGQIIAIDGVASRLKLAKEFGANHTIDVTEMKSDGERISRVLDLTKGRGGDVVCDFVGFPAVVPEGLMMVRMGGTYLEIGNISMGQTVPIDPSSLVWGNKKLVGVVMYDPWVIPKALNLLERTRKRYPFEKVLSHKFPLDKINDAFDQAEWVNRQKDVAIARATLSME